MHGYKLLVLKFWAGGGGVRTFQAYLNVSSNWDEFSSIFSNIL